MNGDGAMSRAGGSWLDCTLSETLGRAAFFAVCLLNLVNITLGEEDAQVTLDLQVMLKLAGVFAAGCYGLWRLYADSRLLPALTAGPMLCFSATCLLLFGTSATSLTPVNSFVSSGSACVVTVATVALMLEIGTTAVVRLLALAAITFVVGSWGVWLFLPAQGIYLEPITHGQFFERMAGLAHPNTLGQLSGMSLLLLFFTCQGLRKAWPLVFWAVALGSFVAMVMCVSRTALAAGCLGFAWGFRGECMAFARRWRADLLLVPLLLGVMVLGAGGLGQDFDRQLAAKISKSDDPEELTSMTGRSLIWAHTLRLAGERPLTGYGMATSKELLREFSLYTHNIVLNVALSAGFVAAGFLLAAILWGGLLAWHRPRPLPDALLLLLVLNGLAENVIFEFLAGGLTAAFVLALAWRTVEGFRHEALLEGARP
jgi:exopolysaccharide production protein ExoQ